MDENRECMKLVGCVFEINELSMHVTKERVARQKHRQQVNTYHISNDPGCGQPNWAEVQSMTGWA